MHDTNLLIIALTTKGAALGRMLASGLDGVLALPQRLEPADGELGFDSLSDFVQARFLHFDAHIFVTAAGIAVRMIAPLIRDKTSDPAVVVLDQLGRHAISLLSGHLGGANELAARVAELTGGRAVITTATDTEGLPSVDMLAYEAGLNMDNPRAIKHLNRALLDGDSIQVWDPLGRLRHTLTNTSCPDRFVHLSDPSRWLRDLPSLLVDWREPAPIAPGPRTLVLRPPMLAVGVGCRYGTFSQDILSLIDTTFHESQLSLKSIAAITSVTHKLNEPGLNDAARQLGVPFRCYPPDDLNRVDVPNPSDAPLNHLGTKSVCEAAALLYARGGCLIVPKTKNTMTTVAVAMCA